MTHFCIYRKVIFNKTIITAILAATVLIAGLTAGGADLPNFVFADSGKKSFKAKLNGYQENPDISTAATGDFKAKLSKDRTELEYELYYSDLEDVTFAVIHLGKSGVNGDPIAFLCGRNGDTACPASKSLTGILTAEDLIGPEDQEIDAGEWDEFLRALRAGVVYVNITTDEFTAGEIRGQINNSDSGDNDNEDDDDDD